MANRICKHCGGIKEWVRLGHRGTWICENRKDRYVDRVGSRVQAEIDDGWPYGKPEEPPRTYEDRLAEGFDMLSDDEVIHLEQEPWFVYLGSLSSRGAVDIAG